MLRAILTNQHDGNNTHIVEGYSREQLLTSALDSLGWSLLDEHQVCDECKDEEPITKCIICGKQLCDDCRVTQDGYGADYCHACRPDDPTDNQR